ncbi:hypothetical protein [Mycolicibacterium sp. 624]|uniref:hypothetical protein n=1 Tax=Mycolicibacterium sp. 624 TaxID=3156314 RepID=UPI003399E0B5
MVWTLPEEFATDGGTIRWAWIDNAGHLLQEDAPAQLRAHLLAGFASAKITR